MGRPAYLELAPYFRRRGSKGRGVGRPAYLELALLDGFARVEPPGGFAAADVDSPEVPVPQRLLDAVELLEARRTQERPRGRGGVVVVPQPKVVALALALVLFLVLRLILLRVLVLVLVLCL